MSKTHTFSFSVSARALRNILIRFIVGAMLTSGVAFAATNSNKYTGCLSADGTLHKVDRGKKPQTACAAGEDQVSWNNKGKRGKKGPQGNIGRTGPAGPVGPEGQAGPDGIDGRDGAEGPQGAAGLQGERGRTGLQGLRGLPGEQGAKGDTGTLPPGAIAQVRQVRVTHVVARDEVKIWYAASCRSNETAIAGGFYLWEDDNEIFSNQPQFDNPQAWAVRMEADDVGDRIDVFATCVRFVS